MLQPFVGGAKGAKLVVSGWEGWHTLDSLSIRVTLANHDRM